MDDIAREILEPFGWDVVDDCVLISCCGESVEYDIEHCPNCGAPNPLVDLAFI